MDVFAYIDDILLYAETEDELLTKLRKLLTRLQAAGLTINRSKCVFGVDKLEFLGYWVHTYGPVTAAKENQRNSGLPTAE